LVFGRLVGERPVAHLIVHCPAGVARSTAAAALILMQANPKWPASAALDAVAAIRPCAWPNLLILELGDSLAPLGAARNVFRGGNGSGFDSGPSGLETPSAALGGSR